MVTKSPDLRYTFIFIFLLSIIILQSVDTGSIMALKYLIIALSLFLSVHNHMLRLNQVVGELKKECWVLDTNNMTAIAMGSCQSAIYFINVGVGTPPQYMNLQVDTARSLVWMPKSSGFEYNQSETFEITEQKTSTYVKDNVYFGHVGSEILTIPETNISIRNSMAWTEEDLSLPYEISGLLGMGFSNIPNFLDNAMNENQIKSSVFSLQIRPVIEESILYYNELPEEITSSTNYVENIGHSTWQVELRSVRVRDFDYSYISSDSMIIESANDIVYLNNDLYLRLIHDYFDACHNGICPCEADYPDITFVLDGIQVVIKSINYMRISEKGCFLLLGKTAYENSPILVGSALMKNYIVTFDKQNSVIGFNAARISSWGSIFLILQFILTGMMFLALVQGVYLFHTMRVCKKSKTRTKSKENKLKKPLNLSMSYLQP